MKKIAIISSHPIQYNAPLFALLSNEPDIDLMVFYTWGEKSLGSKYDPDFGKEIEWDIPLLDGYNYKFLHNTSKKPGSNHFNGIINPALNKEIESWNADVIWVWGWAFNSHLNAMRYFKGKLPVWFRGDSTLLNEDKGVSFKKLARRIFLTWVYRHVEKVFYVGTHNKVYFKKHGVNESQLIYAPHAIDINRFSDMQGNLTIMSFDWRRKLGFLNGDLVLLFAGKFEPRKNPFFLIDLMKGLNSNNVKLLIVGNGPLEFELKKYLSIDNRVTFLNFQNQSLMPVLYRLADFYIIPSVSDTWGLSINEALASGTKVIASCYCGGSIDMINEENGIIFNPKSDIEKVFKYINEAKHSVLSNIKKESLLTGHSYCQIIKSVNNPL